MSETILKTPKTFDEQVEILKTHGVIIHDDEQCKSFLSKVNYYRLSGYFLPFFRDNAVISFDIIRNVYNFDQEMRNLIFKSIEKIEIFIRTQIAYFFSHEYDAEGYLQRENFNEQFAFDKFEKRFRSCIRENRKSPVIKHHKKKYHSHFPLWTVIDYFSLGMLSYFYTGMKKPDKQYLAENMYHIDHKTLSGWMKSLADLRNRCAHYARLYYWSFPSVPAVRRRDKEIHLNHKLFSQLYMLKELYPVPDQWNREFFLPLYDLIDKYKTSIRLKDIGFPDNWISILNQES
ncbi:Abi family protein [uncultured Pseudoramibacter sp.]|uniref:Abi family protein n=1 Tax=uncultured Pseudoramibacter sp. TaxID=1623493 RepID=UPI0025D7E367|nr:Abi family protein [uncultured Pseudoramibacter sp.]